MRILGDIATLMRDTVNKHRAARGSGSNGDIPRTSGAHLAKRKSTLPFQRGRPFHPSELRQVLVQQVPHLSRA